jgi:hypothetical protein
MARVAEIAQNATAQWGTAQPIAPVCAWLSLPTYFIQFLSFFIPYYSS